MNNHERFINFLNCHTGPESEPISIIELAADFGVTKTGTIDIDGVNDVTILHLDDSVSLLLYITTARGTEIEAFEFPESNAFIIFLNGIKNNPSLQDSFKTNANRCYEVFCEAWQMVEEEKENLAAIISVLKSETQNAS